MNCIHCGRQLNESQYAYDENDNEYKSCPKCSADDGEEHIYYRYPHSFGITEKRASKQHPEGPQSCCQPCRGKRPGPHFGAIRCSNIRIL